MQYQILLVNQILLVRYQNLILLLLIILIILIAITSKWWNNFNTRSVFVYNWSFFADFNETVSFLNAVMILNHVILDISNFLFIGTHLCWFV
mgnify:CR=1 FL=1